MRRLAGVPGPLGACGPGEARVIDITHSGERITQIDSHMMMSIPGYRGGDYPYISIQEYEDMFVILYSNSFPA